MQSVNRRIILDIFKESDVLAIWTMKRQDIWYVTFEERFKVVEFDWQIMNSKSVGLTLMFAACDRVVVRAKVHWLPIWVTNEEVNQVFAAQGDIKSINHVMDNSVATGIKEVVFSMQEGKRKHPLLFDIGAWAPMFTICAWPTFNLFQVQYSERQMSHTLYI